MRRSPSPPSSETPGHASWPTRSSACARPSPVTPATSTSGTASGSCFRSSSSRSSCASSASSRSRSATPSTAPAARPSAWNRCRSVCAASTRLANQRIALLGGESEAPDAGPTVSSQMLDDAAAEIVRLQEVVVLAEAALQQAQLATAAARHSLDGVDEEIAAQSALVSSHDLEITKLTGQSDAAASRLAAVRGEVLRQENALEAARERHAAVRAEFALARGRGCDRRCRRDRPRRGLRARPGRPVRGRGRDRAHPRGAARPRTRTRRPRREDRCALVGPRSEGRLGGSRRGSPRRCPRPRRRACAGASGYEAAIAAALGTLADAVLADDLDAATAAVEYAIAEELGRVEVVVARPDRAVTAAVSGDGYVAASGVVNAPDGVLSLLANTVIVDDLAAARSAWRAGLADAATPVTVITRAGDVLTTFVLRGGSGAKRSRLELVAERDAAAERLNDVTSSHRALALRTGRAAWHPAGVEGAVGGGPRRAPRVRLAVGRRSREAQPSARAVRGCRCRAGPSRCAALQLAAERVAEAENAPTAARIGPRCGQVEAPARSSTSRRATACSSSWSRLASAKSRAASSRPRESACVPNRPAPLRWCASASRSARPPRRRRGARSSVVVRWNRRPQ